MQRAWYFAAALTALLLAPSGARAHFPWIVAGTQSPDGKVHIYFSEAAEPDNPALLDRLAKVKLMQATAGEIVELPLSKGSDSLEAAPAGSGPKTFFLKHVYGAISRGSVAFQLNYYAKCYSSDQPRVWTAVGNAEALPLEITPRMEGPQTTLLVTWKGQPLTDATVMIEAEGIENIEGTTSKRGVFSSTLPLGKKYSIRVKHVVAEEGELDGTKYTESRHYATLALHLPSTLTQRTLPDLDPAVTSFGGAIAGDYVYVFGGHLGDAHHYSAEGQSPRLTRLNLKQPDKWEVLAEDLPRRTGTAMVPHRGKLIRVGGFEALNKGADKESLVSRADVASYDPATNQWTDLTPLPKGRSSHDAVVIGDALYVVGGWWMQPGEKTEWHTTALRADLTKSPLVWEEIAAPPFIRRALSLGEWKGQLVAIGGMQEKGGTTRATAIYNPAQKAWSTGPELQGGDMDGFGTSAFAMSDTLYVSTMSGSLQKLNDSGTRWDVIAQLTYPRFFHRMLPTADGRLLFVGGASMQSGKITELELIDPMELVTTTAR